MEPTSSRSAEPSSPSPSPASSTVSTSSSPSSSSASPSPLRPLISSTRSLLVSSAERVAEGEHSAVDYYNGHIVQQTNQQLEGVRAQLHHARHEYGGRVVAGAVVLSGLLSLPFGRFQAVRNAALAGLVTGWLVFPATVTGLLVATKDSLQSAPAVPPEWTRKGEEAVRQGGRGGGGDGQRMVGTFSSAGNGRHLSNATNGTKG